MRTVKLVLEYDGTAYCGWQSQHNGVSVQQQLEKALAVILNEKVGVTAAGRTDAGVHAAGQVAHFTTTSGRSCTAIVKGGNTLLPADIRIISARDAGNGFHARYGARGKRYRYTIRSEPSVFDPHGSWYVKYPLDLGLMRQAAAHLLGTHDFRSFCVAQSIKPHYRCTITRLAVARKGRIVTITVDGDRFLHNMVRIIAGTLVDAGRGKIGPDRIPAILAARNRNMAGRTAPAQGLCLINVKYR